MKKVAIVLWLITLIGLVIFAIGYAFGEPTEAWVLCQPDSYINIRHRADKYSGITGHLYSGDNIYLDGKEQYGYLHCVNLPTEEGEGWVAKGYVVDSKPSENGGDYLVKANGRVAARRTVDGYRRCWLHTGDRVTVYMVSDIWCLTNKGFVKTECIDLVARVGKECPDPDLMTWEED